MKSNRGSMHVYIRSSDNRIVAGPAEVVGAEAAHIEAHHGREEGMTQRHPTGVTPTGALGQKTLAYNPNPHPLGRAAAGHGYHQAMAISGGAEPAQGVHQPGLIPAAPREKQQQLFGAEFGAGGRGAPVAQAQTPLQRGQSSQAPKTPTQAPATSGQRTFPGMTPPVAASSETPAPVAGTPARAPEMSPAASVAGGEAPGAVPAGVQAPAAPDVGALEQIVDQARDDFKGFAHQLAEKYPGGGFEDITPEEQARWETLKGAHVEAYKALRQAEGPGVQRDEMGQRVVAPEEDAPAAPDAGVAPDAPLAPEAGAAPTPPVADRWGQMADEMAAQGSGEAPDRWGQMADEMAAQGEGAPQKKTPSAPTPSAPTPSAPTPSAPTPSAPTPSAAPPTAPGAAPESGQLRLFENPNGATPLHGTAPPAASPGGPPSGAAPSGDTSSGAAPSGNVPDDDVVHQQYGATTKHYIADAFPGARQQIMAGPTARHQMQAVGDAVRGEHEQRAKTVERVGKMSLDRLMQDGYHPLLGQHLGQQTAAVAARLRAQGQAAAAPPAPQGPPPAAPPSQASSPEGKIAPAEGPPAGAPKEDDKTTGASPSGQPLAPPQPTSPKGVASPQPVQGAQPAEADEQEPEDGTPADLLGGEQGEKTRKPRLVQSLQERAPVALGGSGAAKLDLGENEGVQHRQEQLDAALSGGVRLGQRPEDREKAERARHAGEQHERDWRSKWLGQQDQPVDDPEIKNQLAHLESAEGHSALGAALGAEIGRARTQGQGEIDREVAQTKGKREQRGLRTMRERGPYRGQREAQLTAIHNTLKGYASPKIDARGKTQRMAVLEGYIRDGHLRGVPLGDAPPAPEKGLRQHEMEQARAYLSGEGPAAPEHTPQEAAPPAPEMGATGQSAAAPEAQPSPAKQQEGPTGSQKAAPAVGPDEDLGELHKTPEGRSKLRGLVEGTLARNDIGNDMERRALAEMAGHLHNEASGGELSQKNHEAITAFRDWLKPNLERTRAGAEGKESYTPDHSATGHEQYKARIGNTLGHRGVDDVDSMVYHARQGHQRAVTQGHDEGRLSDEQFSHLNTLSRALWKAKQVKFPNSSFGRGALSEVHAALPGAEHYLNRVNPEQASMREGLQTYAEHIHKHDPQAPSLGHIKEMMALHGGTLKLPEGGVGHPEAPAAVQGAGPTSPPEARAPITSAPSAPMGKSAPEGSAGESPTTPPPAGQKAPAAQKGLSPEQGGAPDVVPEGEQAKGFVNPLEHAAPAAQQEPEPAAPQAQGTDETGPPASVLGGPAQSGAEQPPAPGGTAAPRGPITRQSVMDKAARGERLTDEEKAFVQSPAYARGGRGRAGEAKTPPGGVKTPPKGGPSAGTGGWVNPLEPAAPVVPEKAPAASKGAPDEAPVASPEAPPAPEETPAGPEETGGGLAAQTPEPEAPAERTSRVAAAGAPSSERIAQMMEEARDRRTLLSNPRRTEPTPAPGYGTGKEGPDSVPVRHQVVDKTYADGTQATEHHYVAGHPGAQQYRVMGPENAEPGHTTWSVHKEVPGADGKMRRQHVAGGMDMASAIGHAQGLAHADQGMAVPQPAPKATQAPAPEAKVAPVPEKGAPEVTSGGERGPVPGSAPEGAGVPEPKGADEGKEGQSLPASPPQSLDKGGGWWSGAYHGTSHPGGTTPLSTSDTPPSWAEKGGATQEPERPAEGGPEAVKAEAPAGTPEPASAAPEGVGAAQQRYMQMAQHPEQHKEVAGILQQMGQNRNLPKKLRPALYGMQQAIEGYHGAAGNAGRQAQHQRQIEQMLPHLAGEIQRQEGRNAAAATSRQGASPVPGYRAPQAGPAEKASEEKGPEVKAPDEGVGSVSPAAQAPTSETPKDETPKPTQQDDVGAKGPGAGLRRPPQSSEEIAQVYKEQNEERRALRSKGHQFNIGNDEYVLHENGQLYKASRLNPLDTDGYRMGLREHSPAHMAQRTIENLRPKAEKDAAEKPQEASTDDHAPERGYVNPEEQPAAMGEKEQPAKAQEDSAVSSEKPKVTTDEGGQQRIEAPPQPKTRPVVGQPPARPGAPVRPTVAGEGGIQPGRPQTSSGKKQAQSDQAAFEQGMGQGKEEPQQLGLGEATPQKEGPTEAGVHEPGAGRTLPPAATQPPKKGEGAGEKPTAEGGAKKPPFPGWNDDAMTKKSVGKPSKLMQGTQAEQQAQAVAHIRDHVAQNLLRGGQQTLDTEDDDGKALPKLKSWEYRSGEERKETGFPRRRDEVLRTWHSEIGTPAEQVAHLAQNAHIFDSDVGPKPADPAAQRKWAIKAAMRTKGALGAMLKSFEGSAHGAHQISPLVANRYKQLSEAMVWHAQKEGRLLTPSEMTAHYGGSEEGRAAPAEHINHEHVAHVISQFKNKNYPVVAAHAAEQRALADTGHAQVDGRKGHPDVEAATLHEVSRRLGALGEHKRLWDTNDEHEEHLLGEYGRTLSRQGLQAKYDELVGSLKNKMPLQHPDLGQVGLGTQRAVAGSMEKYLKKLGASDVSGKGHKVPEWAGPRDQKGEITTAPVQGSKGQKKGPSGPTFTVQEAPGGWAVHRDGQAISQHATEDEARAEADQQHEDAQENLASRRARPATAPASEAPGDEEPPRPLVTTPNAYADLVRTPDGAKRYYDIVQHAYAQTSDPAAKLALGTMGKHLEGIANDPTLSADERGAALGHAAGRARGLEHHLDPSRLALRMQGAKGPQVSPDLRKKHVADAVRALQNTTDEALDHLDRVGEGSLRRMVKGKNGKLKEDTGLYAQHQAHIGRLGGVLDRVRRAVPDHESVEAGHEALTDLHAGLVRDALDVTRKSLKEGQGGKPMGAILAQGRRGLLEGTQRDLARVAPDHPLHKEAQKVIDTLDDIVGGPSGLESAEKGTLPGQKESDHARILREWKADRAARGNPVKSKGEVAGASESPQGVSGGAAGAEGLEETTGASEPAQSAQTSSAQAKTPGEHAEDGADGLPPPWRVRAAERASNPELAERHRANVAAAHQMVADDVADRGWAAHEEDPTEIVGDLHRDVLRQAGYNTHEMGSIPQQAHDEALEHAHDLLGEGQTGVRQRAEGDERLRQGLDRIGQGPRTSELGPTAHQVTPTGEERPVAPTEGINHQHVQAIMGRAQENQLGDLQEKIDEFSRVAKNESYRLTGPDGQPVTHETAAEAVRQLEALRDQKEAQQKRAGPGVTEEEAVPVARTQPVAPKQGRTAAQTIGRLAAGDRIETPQGRMFVSGHHVPSGQVTGAIGDKRVTINLHHHAPHEVYRAVHESGGYLNPLVA